MDVDNVINIDYRLNIDKQTNPKEDMTNGRGNNHILNKKRKIYYDDLVWVEREFKTMKILRLDYERMEKIFADFVKCKTNDILFCRSD